MADLEGWVKVCGLAFVLVIAFAVFVYIQQGTTLALLDKERAVIELEREQLKVERVKLEVEFNRLEKERQKNADQLQEVIEFYETRTDPSIVPPWMK